MNARDTKHEARILVMAMMAVCSAVALAMPTQQELKKAQPLVVELMAPTMDDFKAKKKTAAEVADMAVKYAGEAETEAAKFMLYRSSIPYYVRGEAYDKAADAVELMKANVKDVPASVVEEIISKATVRATAKKAPRLFELYRQAKAQSVAEKDVAAFRAKLKKNPGSLPTIRNLAEALATSGDWDAALKEFVKLRDKAAQMAKDEQDGSAKSVELGEFWWSYKPTYENADDTFEMHAAVHYRKALAAGEITGLKKNIVEQRIAKYTAAEALAGGQGTSPRTPAATGLYCVIDLSGGPDAKKYPVSYLNDMPKGGWSDEYKTTKLVLRRIEPGKPVLVGRGSEQRRTSVSEPYYLGVFEVTQGQWEQVMGTRPSFWRGKDYKKRPVECVSYDLIRGKNKGSEWPKSNEVDPGSFLGCLREKSGVAFDLPIERQWEYACAAETDTDYNNGGMCTDNTKNEVADVVGRYRYNGGWDDDRFGKHDFSNKVWKPEIREGDSKNGTAVVGSYVPNKWGFYDMHGNVWEWCLDWDEDHSGDRVLRSSWWLDWAWECRTSVRKHLKSNSCAYMQGFRLCLPLAGGAATQTPAAITPAAGSIELKTGGSSPFTVKGNEATLELLNGVTLDFVKCPAGSFNMTLDKKSVTERVFISRPFWFLKYNLTKRQADICLGRSPRNKDGVMQGLRSEDEQICSYLTGKFGDLLPKGMIFRLPSLAELEYAFHANEKDSNSPYFDTHKALGKDRVAYVSKNANAWGIDWRDGPPSFRVIDTFNPEWIQHDENGRYKHLGTAIIGNRLKGTDVLYVATVDKPFYVSRNFEYGVWFVHDPTSKESTGPGLRIVIGPDLVSERKAKNAKK